MTVSCLRGIGLYIRSLQMPSINYGKRIEPDQEAQDNWHRIGIEFAELSVSLANNSQVIPAEFSIFESN